MILQAQRFSRFFAATILAFTFLLLMSSVAWGQTQGPTTTLISTPFIPDANSNMRIAGGQSSNISGSVDIIGGTSGTVVYEAGGSFILFRDISGPTPVPINVFTDKTARNVSTNSTGKIFVYETRSADLNFPNNGTYNIVLSDRDKNITLVSGVNNISGNRDSTTAAINSNSAGSQVVFVSSATNLVPQTLGMQGISNNIFLREANGTITLISKDANGMPFTTQNCTNPSIDDTGVVVFEYNGRIYVSRDPQKPPVTISTSEIEPASHPTISRNSGIIAFQSRGGTSSTVNGPSIMFAQLTANSSQLLPGFSISNMESPSNDRVHSTVGPVLNANGSIVAFTSSLDYVNILNNRLPTVYVANVGSSQIPTIVSVGNSNQAATAQSGSPSINDTGMFVSFDSQDPTLDSNNATAGGGINVYVRNLTGGAGGIGGGAGTISIGAVCPNTTRTTTTAVSIGWAIHSNPAGSRIRIVRFDQSGNYKLLADLAGEDAGNSYTDKDLTPGTVYKYRVWVATNGFFYPNDFTVKTKKIKQKK